MKIVELACKKPRTINKEEYDKRIKELRKERATMKKGKFEFSDANGGWIDFTYRVFPDDPIFLIKLVHGETCELPLDMVKHINNTVRKVRMTDLTLVEGNIHQKHEKISRIRFVPADVL